MASTSSVGSAAGALIPVGGGGLFDKGGDAKGAVGSFDGEGAAGISIMAR